MAKAKTKKAAKASTKKSGSAKSKAKKATKKGSSKKSSVKSSTKKKVATKASTKKAAAKKSSTKKSVKKSTKKVAAKKKPAKKSASAKKSTAKKTPVKKSGAKKASSKTKSVKKPSKKVSTKKTAKSSAKKSTKKVAKKAVKKTTKKTAKKTAKKMANKVVSKTAKKASAKKAATKVKATKASARKSATKKSVKVSAKKAVKKVSAKKASAKKPAAKKAVKKVSAKKAAPAKATSKKTSAKKASVKARKSVAPATKAPVTKSAKKAAPKKAAAKKAVAKKASARAKVSAKAAKAKAAEMEATPVAKKVNKPDPNKPISETLYFRTDNAYLCMILNRRTAFARVIDFRAGTLPAKRLYIQSTAQQEGIAKVIVLVEKDEVSSWTKVGFVREGSVPGFYKRSDGHLCGCVIGDRTASVSISDASAKRAEKTINAGKKHGKNIPEEIKATIKSAETSVVHKARDAAWKKGDAFASFDTFGRDAAEMFFKVEAKGARSNFLRAEYQDCFGHSMMELLYAPENEHDILATTAVLREAGETLKDRGIVSAFLFAPTDHVELAIALTAAGYRKTGLLAQAVLFEGEHKDAILWSRKLANPAADDDE